MNYLNQTTCELRERKPEIAILPLGSFENHGPHLPVNTDNIQIEAVAEEIARELNAFLLPVQPITTCYEHHGKRGSIHYSYNIFFKLLTGILERLYRQDFKKIAVLLGHGGIFIAEPAICHLNNKYKDLLVFLSEYYYQFDDRNMHAGECETSRMLYQRPDLVQMDKAVDFIPEKPRCYLTYGSIFTHSPDGVWGNAALATAEKGEILYEKSLEGMLKEIQEAFSLYDKGGL
jgi:creatinine amidohydrolase